MPHAEFLFPESSAVAVDHPIGLLEELLVFVGMDDAHRRGACDTAERQADKKQRDECPKNSARIGWGCVEDGASE
jgi:hypothetical protein